MKQRLKGNLGQEPKLFKPGKQHLLCILLAGFCTEVAVFCERKEQDGHCGAGEVQQPPRWDLAPPGCAPVIFQCFCLINIRPAQAQPPSLDVSLVNHATLLALGNDLERIYQPMMAGVRN